MVLQYDLDQIDWKEYLLHLSCLISGIKNYQDKLNRDLSNVDMCICDLMHYLELYDLKDEDYLKAASMIKNFRKKRRVIKDKARMIECFQKTIGTNANLLKIKKGINLINKMECRNYVPRVLSELFTEELALSNGKEEFSEITEERGEHKREDKVELEKRETIFDTRENDWESFVTEQVAFFADIKQYAFNLQIDLKKFDMEIEQILCQIEKTNCNAAQGYKVFKQLKDLRSERNRMAKELEYVQTITQSFDCELMRDTYRYCAETISCQN